MQFRDLICTAGQVYAKDGHGRVAPVPSSNQQVHELVRRHGLDSEDGIRRAREERGRDHLLVDEIFGRLRVSIMVTVDGPAVALRSIHAEAPTLDALGLQTDTQEGLLNLQSGLALIAGTMGSGKTTTASAYVKSYLHKYGGSCVTLEDPPEVYLNGLHGNGVCEQCEVPSAKFAEEMVFLLRHAAPEVIFLGELREEKAATEAVRAASNGHLVIATVHAGSVVETVSRMMAFLTSERGRMIFAEAVAGIVKQRLMISGNGNVKVREDTLFVNSAPNREAIRAVIRAGEQHKLSNEIEQQRFRR